ncbi:hypothetical protein [Leptospira stimsonii]|uniref:Uncharacterized protein n=1 Tax=Leptospira stimsonii TaxID=2202203 RepID=A0ABY2N5L4_9LEPT|nr:hypothetical protein [Leptospira stimsonii]TGK10386.1 hypothetical protein EHO98_23025 [Leptospira stimsonii]TGM17270.1 hypothetical protein EHQ90_07770 [Leptospira stimsonii]
MRKKLLVTSLLMLALNIFSFDNDSKCTFEAIESRGNIELQVNLPKSSELDNKNLTLITEIGTFPMYRNRFKIPFAKVLEARRNNLIAEWSLQSGQNALCNIEIDLQQIRSPLLYKHVMNLGSKKINIKDYHYITTGMTIEEVTLYLGKDGEEELSSEVDGYTSIGLSWRNPDGSNLTIIFLNGKVFAKNHIGLK